MTMLRKILGYSLISLGVVGLFLPFIQGIALIALGFAVLHHQKIRKTLKSTAVKVHHIIKKAKNNRLNTKKYKSKL